MQLNKLALASDGGGSGGSIDNLCVIGGECGRVLEKHVGSGKAETIYVNFPEPPQQRPGEGETAGHMLMDENLKIIGRTLIGGGR